MEWTCNALYPQTKCVHSASWIYVGRSQDREAWRGTSETWERPSHRSLSGKRHLSVGSRPCGGWSSKFQREIASAMSLSFPLIWETSSWIPIVVAVRHSFSRKKANGIFVANNEFTPASAPVLSERLEIRREYLCAGICCDINLITANWASVS